MPELLHRSQREALATRIKFEIDEWCRVNYDDGFRNHLGASMIGNGCARYLWYSFRWVEAGAFSGRMQRLFNRGHETEHRFITWLRGIGFTVWDVDPNTGKQWRINGSAGHFGGSCDGIVRAPTEWALPTDLLLEMKTSGTGRKFTDLVEKGVKEAKPIHYAQMCSYGLQYGLKYALYMCINKNDDDLHVEIVELDWDLGRELLGKAQDIITVQQPPPRINESPAFHLCKLCDRKEVCHGGAQYEKNCRSCQFAVPIMDGASAGEWGCTKWNQVLPEEVIRVGCDSWHPVGRA